MKTLKQFWNTIKIWGQRFFWLVRDIRNIWVDISDVVIDFWEAPFVDADKSKKLNIKLHNNIRKLLNRERYKKMIQALFTWKRDGLESAHSIPSNTVNQS